MSSSPLRILIAEDSALFVEVLCDLLADEEDIEIIDIADNGEDAVRRCLETSPDLVVMDIQMPRLDGLSATELIMARAPTPILVMTSDPWRNGVDLSFRALSAGALDLIPKPEHLPLDEEERRDLVRKIRLLADIPVIRHVRGRRRHPTPTANSTSGGSKRSEERRSRERRRRRAHDEEHKNEEHKKSHHARKREEGASTRRPVPRGPYVAIAASTGGPKALARLLRDLPADLGAAVLIVQHISRGFSTHLARWLDTNCPLRVSEAVSGVRPRSGHVYLAPSDHHLELTSAGRLRVHEEGPIRGHRPSGDLLFESIAAHAPERTIGIVLSGMGQDGARGLEALFEAGADTIVQDRDSAVIYGMPQSALDRGAVRSVVALERMADAIISRIERLEGDEGDGA
jgi:two-component system chemotaxis response regulator CheB